MRRGEKVRSRTPGGRRGGGRLLGVARGWGGSAGGGKGGKEKKKRAMKGFTVQKKKEWIFIHLGCSVGGVARERVVEESGGGGPGIGHS